MTQQMDPLVTYLNERSDALGILRLSDVERLLNELIPKHEFLLPRPYKIFYEDEIQEATLGFPVCDSTTLHELDVKLDRWIGEEIAWHLDKSDSRDKVSQSFNNYLTHLMRLAENALLSNLLADYHAIFWLVHSGHLAKQFSVIPRRVGAINVQAGRLEGDELKYRIFAKWSNEVKDQMTRMAARVAPILDGEEERGMQCFRLFQENLLILTEEHISPDLREMKSFISGYLHIDFQNFREIFQRLQSLSTDLLRKDPSFRAAVTAFKPAVAQGMSLSSFLDQRFQEFLFSHPGIEPSFNRDEREQLRSISRRLCEYTILHQLRRSLTWMTVTEEGDVLPADRRGAEFSRSTRPVDFSKPGVVDPMVYRFGLIYDITAFTETLGSVARSGRKGEINAYRQMLLFQRKLEIIAERHHLQFEKFLGDGAFYTTRRALGLINAAIEIQKFYSDMRKKGFAFNRGIRIGLNYGYYRLLPMKTRPDSQERTMEFYGPGVVELSRLVTGKAAKEIDEIQTFLVGHGYDPIQVRNFFSALAQGVDVVDRNMHEREYFAYINANSHLVNEGIVASRPLIEELSGELVDESRQVYRLRSRWGTYLGFVPMLEGVDYVGVRILGSVGFKGLDKVEVSEIVPFVSGEVDAAILDNTDRLITQLRHEQHEESVPRTTVSDERDTEERAIEYEILLCAGADKILPGMIVLGEWDPKTDELHNPVQIAETDLQELIAFEFPISKKMIESQKNSIRNLYRKMSEGTVSDTLPLAPFRAEPHFTAYLLGESVEKL